MCNGFNSSSRRERKKKRLIKGKKSSDIVIIGKYDLVFDSDENQWVLL